MTTKPQRPRAGLGLSSAVTAEQMKTRKVATPRSRKPEPVKSRKPDRTKPDKAKA